MYILLLTNLYNYWSSRYLSFAIYVFIKRISFILKNLFSILDLCLFAKILLFKYDEFCYFIVIYVIILAVFVINQSQVIFFNLFKHIYLYVASYQKKTFLHQ